MIQYLTEGLDGTDSVINSIKYYRLSVSERNATILYYERCKQWISTR